MSNYVKSTNFATKDNLTPGDPLKVVRGTEIDTEYNNIATAIATKTDNASAAITGGTITGITDLAVADGGTGASTATAALNNLLPSQTSNANKYLQTDGTNATWDAVSLSTSDITGTLPVANGGTGVTSSTGTGSVVLSNSPTLVTPALGTPSALVGTNITGTASGLTAGTVTTNANLTGAVTSVGNATSLGSFSSANLLAALTDETGTGSAVFATSPTLVTPALGTPSALVGTNITGTASGLTAGNVTTNANLTGAVTSVGNATSLGSFSSANLLGALTDETGTGSAVFATSPTLVTPILGTPTSATLTNATGLPIATGVSGLGTGVATFLATPSSANLAAALTDETGTGSAVFATSPTLVTPLLGTPTSGVATNLTGLPLTTGVTGTLPTANGGTNLTSFTSGGVVYASSASALATGSVLSFDGTTLSGKAFSAIDSTNIVNLLTLKDTGTTYSNGNNYVAIVNSTNAVAGLIYHPEVTSLGISGNTALIFGTGSTPTEGMRLTSTGLGIGTSSPAGKFDITGASNSTVNSYLRAHGGTSARANLILDMYTTTAGAAGNLTFQRANTNTLGGTTDVSSGDHLGYINFYGTSRGNGSYNAGGSIQVVVNGAASTYVPADMYIYTNSGSTDRSGSPQLTVNSNGTIRFLSTISVGNATPSTSGAGITFPATQSASSDANTLDDYEEGTWTPNQGAGLTVVGTFTSSGIYTKIGNLVCVNFRVGGTTSIACSASGEVTTNLPFSIAGSPGNGMGSCQNSNGVNTGAYGYLAGINISTVALPTAGAILVTITYQV